LIYIFPVLMLIAGAVLGQKIASLYQMHESIALALTGIGFLGLSFLVIWWSSSTLAGKWEDQPRIVKIVSKR
jgi:sigma-E factor negative regulatory protein RseC